MSLDPPARNSPREITVRFRHPEGRQIRKVTVNQKDWKEFDALKGDIRLPAELKTHAEIRR